MKPLDYPLLSDENIHPAVVAALREQGKDVLTALEAGLAGQSDANVIRIAEKQGRAIVTHDRDFGLLAMHGERQRPSVIYLRPGQGDPKIVLDSLRAIENTVDDVSPGFLLVAEQRENQVRIRLRPGPLLP